MSGRGAKGSIKDRLISMLYRYRYKKKKLKEENYKVPSKEKQVKYLNKLQDFKEKEDINILDNTDKKRLDDVKFNANFKVGIDDTSVNIELSSIENKTDELTDKVNIKKEINKTKDEVVILKEVNNFIKKSIDAIDEIKRDVEELKQESKIKNKDTKSTEEKYAKLKKKIENLKTQYDTIKDKYDLSEFSIIQSIKLMDAIDDYKSLASLNELDMMLNVCKKEINKIKSITIINESKKQIGSNIESVKEEQKSVKIKFNKSKEDINRLDSLEKDILYEIKYQEEVVNDMYDKASYYEKEISKKIETIGHRKILSSLFRIAGGILTIPFTGKNLFGVALGSTMINKGLKEMNRKLETKEKIEVNFLPEYKSVLESINALESKLIENQKKLNNMDKKLDKEKDLNKQKLKIVEK